MKHEKLSQALNEISAAHIKEAASPKRRRLPWIGAIAAVLALVIGLQFIRLPMALEAGAVSLADSPRITQMPDLDDYSSRELWLADLAQWEAERETRGTTASEALGQMEDFLKQSSREFLSGSDGNRLYSPINAYIGLAMAAELTGNNTRRQLLDALGAASIEALRAQISALWETVYRDNGNEICTLASSLWLDDALEFNQNAMDTLARDYYASVYRRDLNDIQAAKDIRAWLNNNTGGFLRDAVDGVQLPEQSVMALYSTIYFRAKWTDEFNASKNTEELFHAPDGDISCTFMNKDLAQMNYYWGESYGAVSLHLKNGSQMWFILPDEDKCIDDVLAQGEYLDMVTASHGNWENTKYMMVNLSVPKFDVNSHQDLRQGLNNMGITDLFHFGTADFSNAFSVPAAITAANQAVRVAIDEKGVTAAAYIELPAAGAAAPPDEIIDFILDRPFLFVISDNSGIPLFAGAVHNPG